jgi:hypothetical protein
MSVQTLAITNRDIRHSLPPDALYIGDHPEGGPMSVFDMFRQAGIVSLLTLAIDFAPLAMAVAYFVRPTERRLALMRPMSLAGLFAAVTGGANGFLHLFRNYGIAPESSDDLHRRVAIGAAESMVPVVVGFTCLTVAWLLVAAGMSRSRAEP